jgi:hypothetical protein
MSGYVCLGLDVSSNIMLHQGTSGFVKLILVKSGYLSLGRVISG